MASAFAALIAGMGWRIWHECPTIGEHLISGGHRLVSDNQIPESRFGQEKRFKSEEEVKEYCKLALARKRFLIPYWRMEEYKDYCTLNMNEVLIQELEPMQVQGNKIFDISNKNYMKQYIKGFDKHLPYPRQKLILEKWCQENSKIHYAHINTLTEILMREWCYSPKSKK